MYKMELNINEKILIITMSGFMTEEESVSYVDELGINIKNINSIQYNIVVDSRELKTSSPHLVRIMEQAMELITNIPFTTRYSIMPKDNIATLQVKKERMENNKIKDRIFVESYEVVLKSIG